ncbi:hypothetical protein OBBRIDRAFT_726918, partial [Obba rivulosa]
PPPGPGGGEVGPLNPPYNPKPKLVDPLVFNGKRDRLEFWLSSLQIVIWGREQDYTTAKSKIMMALFHMAGNQVDEWKNNLTEWGPIDQVTAASTKLIALQYDPGNRIDSFIVKFENLALKAGITEDAALLPMFRLKLPAPVQINIMDKTVHVILRQ